MKIEGTSQSVIWNILSLILSNVAYEVIYQESPVCT
jgi:hypothetical protein